MMRRLRNGRERCDPQEGGLYRGVASRQMLLLLSHSEKVGGND